MNSSTMYCIRHCWFYVISSSIFHVFPGISLLCPLVLYMTLCGHFLKWGVPPVIILILVGLSIVNLAFLGSPMYGNPHTILQYDHHHCCVSPVYLFCISWLYIYIKSCHIISYHIIYHISYHIISYHIISYHYYHCYCSSPMYPIYISQKPMGRP